MAAEDLSHNLLRESLKRNGHGQLLDWVWLPSRQKQVYNRRTVRTAISTTMTTTGGQSGQCQVGSLYFGLNLTFSVG